MALNLKGLLSRKKKARAAAEDERGEPFFTGATLGPGLGADDHDDDASAGGDGGSAPTRGFDDLLDDDAWGGGDGDGDDGERPQRGGGRKRMALFASIGLGAALIAGGGAWWVLTQDHGLLPGAGEQHAEAGEAPATPAEAMASGGRVSLPMPPAPGLAPGGSGSAAVVVDPTAATDRSAERRPWLAEGTPAEPAAEPAAPATPAAQAQAPAEPADSAPEAAAEAPPPAEAAPAQPAQTAAAPVPVPEPAVAAKPAGPVVEDVSKPDARTAGAPPPSFDAMPEIAAKAEPLKAAPIADLVRNTPAGPLPIAAPDGRKAWSAYAKPFEAPAGTPRVAVVVADLGLMPAATEAAIAKLPAGVTLAFSPYGFDVPAAMQRARQAGHEVMMTLPMEHRGFPAHDPGPLGLNTLLPVNDNIIRLNTVMTKGVGYVGLLGRGGQSFTAKADLMKPVLEAVSRAGLLYVQPSAGVQLASYGQVGTPTAVVDLDLDEKPYRNAIEARLKALETLARERGSAVAVIDPTPLAFDAVSKWLAEVQTRGIALAPVSAVVRP